MKIAHDSGEEHLQLMRQLGVEYVVSAVGPGLHRAFRRDNLVPLRLGVSEGGTANH